MCALCVARNREQLLEGGHEVVEAAGEDVNERAVQHVLTAQPDHLERDVIPLKFEDLEETKRRKVSLLLE